MRYVCLVMFFYVSCVAHAEVYQHRDAEGHITYTDQPMPESEKVDLPPASVVYPAESSVELRPSSSSPGQYAPMTPSSNEGEELDSVPEVVSASEYYKTFSLRSPEADETFHNQRHIDVMVSIEPSLREGNAIQFLLDGVLVNQPSSSVTTTLFNLDRGSHTVQAQLLDQNGHVVKSTESVTIYIHYAVQ